MILSLNQIDNVHKTLSKFAEQKLPIKLSYKLMKILSQFEDEIKFFQERVGELIEDYALRDENGEIVYSEDRENIKLKDGTSEEFSEKYNELIELEIEVDDFSFTLDELEKLELTPKELYTLQDFIKE